MYGRVGGAMNGILSKASKVAVQEDRITTSFARKFGKYTGEIGNFGDLLKVMDGVEVGKKVASKILKPAKVV